MAVLIFSIRNADNLVLITLISFPYEDQELGQGSTHHSLFGGKYIQNSEELSCFRAYRSLLLKARVRAGRLLTRLLTLISSKVRSK